MRFVKSIEDLALAKTGAAAPSSCAPSFTACGWADFVFGFHDDEEIGPRMLARIAKHTGLRPEDL